MASVTELARPSWSKLLGATRCWPQRGAVRISRGPTSPFPGMLSPKVPMS
jgi:hypothetical protein